ncbi:neuraminidase-like domain-containing protein [Rhizobium johnstonii]|uniref:Tc toxin subunit A-related protein n=1 Tax=Rhizobium johnstonii TaxID=3019933 RepID=UPI003F99F4FB
MKPVKPTKSTDGDSILTAVLHDAILVLWAFPDAKLPKPVDADLEEFMKEKDDREYGPITTLQIQAFQQVHKLPNQSGDVDAATADHLNKFLLDHEQFGRFTGQFVDRDNVPIQGRDVQLWLVKDGTETLIETEKASTRQDGTFILEYERYFRPNAYRLKFYDDKVIHQTEVYRDVPALQPVGIIKYPGLGKVESRAITADIESVLKRLETDAYRMTSKDSRTVATETSYALEQISSWAIAHRLAAFANVSLEGTKTALPWEFFYALLRLDAFLYVDWCASSAKADASTRPFLHLEISLDEFPAWDVKKKKWTSGKDEPRPRLLLSLISTYTSEPQTDEDPKPSVYAYRELVRLLIDADRARIIQPNRDVEDPKDEIKLLKQASGARAGEPDADRYVLNGDRSGKAEWQTEQAITELRLLFPCAEAPVDLGGYCGSAIEPDGDQAKTLATASGSRLIFATALPDLKEMGHDHIAAVPPSHWRKVLSARRTRSGAARSDATRDALIASRARMLAETLEVLYPDKAFAAQLERKGGAKLSAQREAMRAAPDFAVEDGNAVARTLSADKKAAVMSTQRAFRLSRKYDRAAVLMENGWDSAWTIRRLGAPRFKRSYIRARTSALEATGDPIDPSVLEQEAREIIARADLVAHLAASVGAACVSEAQALQIGGFASPQGRVELRRAVKDGLAKLPTLETLFGSLDTCHCSHAESVYGPASYLVDALEFLYRREAFDENDKDISPLDELLTRRSDLGYLDLNAANAETELPYIDLVCELLEELYCPSDFSVNGEVESGKTLGDHPTLAQSLRARFPDIADAARINGPDGSSCLVVRDDYHVIRLEPDTGPDQRTASSLTTWQVRRFPQTYRSSEELLAAPEFVNVDAYAALKRAKKPLTLPFDLHQVVITGYFSKLPFSRHRLMAALLSDAAWTTPDTHLTEWKPIASESLGLPQCDWDIISTAEVGETKQKAYWPHTWWKTVIDDTGCAITSLQVTVADFLDYTKWQYAQLEELLDGDFANPDRRITIAAIVVDGQDREDSCRADQRKLQGLETQDLDRWNRFIRLQSTLGWRINLLDRLISAPSIGRGRLNEQCLHALAALKRLADEWQKPLENVASLFVTLATRGKPSEYQGIFLLPASNGYVDRDFLLASMLANEVCADDSAGAYLEPCKRLREKVPYLALSLGISQADVGEIIDSVGQNKGLTLRNVSQVYSWRLLGKLLRLPVKDIRRICSVAAIADPLASPAQLRLLLAASVTLRKWGINATDLDFWLRHQSLDEDRPKYELDQSAISALLRTLRKRFNDLGAALPATSLKGATRDECMQRLSDALAIIGDAYPDDFKPEQRRRFEDLVLKRITQTDVEVLAALIEQLGKLIPDLALPTEILALGSWPEIDPPDATEPGMAEMSRGSAAGPDAAETKRKAEEDKIAFANHREFVQAVASSVSKFNKTNMRLEIAIAETAKSIKLSVEEAKWILIRGMHPVRTDKAIQVLADALTDDKIAEATEAEQFPLEAWRSQYQAAWFAQKIGGFARALKISPDVIDWLLDRRHADSLGWLSLDRLPAEPTPADATAPWKQFLELLAGLQLLREYPQSVRVDRPDEKLGAQDLFERAIGSGDVLADTLKILSLLVGRETSRLIEVARYLQISDAALTSARVFRRVLAVDDIGEQLGLSIENAEPLTAFEVTAEAVGLAREVLKRRTDDAEWLAVLRAVNDPLRERKRAALLAALLSDPVHHPYSDENDIYNYLLVDPLMTACLQTSRIVLAHGSVQLFVQRCLMGLEWHVHPSAEDQGWKEWRTWMQNYRTWEANRKIFLYPENWMDPNLRTSRDGKSEFFSELEQLLLQNDINNANVESAARQYLEKLDSAAFLEVVAVHYQERDADLNDDNDDSKVLHVIARSKGGDPRAYYYRQFRQEKTWTPWEKIELDISTDHILTFIRNRRLHLAWPVFTEIVDENATYSIPTGSEQPPKIPRGWEIQLAISERTGGRWLPKRTSEEAIKPEPGKLIKCTSDDMSALRERHRLYIRDNEPKAPSVESYDVLPADAGPADEQPEGELEDPTRGFFIIVYGFLTPGAADGPPMRLGAFNLTGCKGFPELVKPEILDRLLIGSNADYAQGQIVLPTMKDADFVTQRWIEQDRDLGQEFAISGLRGMREHYREVLATTPGTFRVTTANHYGAVDRAIVAAQKISLAENQPVGEFNQRVPNGTMLPFFYEDGRRGYVVIPVSLSPKTKATRRVDKETATVSGYLDILATLLPSLERLSESDSKDRRWKPLIESWKADETKSLALVKLQDYLLRDFRLQFLPFYHPFTCAMRIELERGGLEALFQLQNKVPRNPISFRGVYRPQPNNVALPYPEEAFHFFESSGIEDAYSLYNWEVFYHLPSLVARKLNGAYRYQEALQWHHFIFDPTGTSSKQSGNLEAPQRYWITKPFRKRQKDSPNGYEAQSIAAILKKLAKADGSDEFENLKRAVDEWRRRPYSPYAIAKYRTVAYQKATVMDYLDTVIQLGDQFFRQDTMESVNLAQQMYMLARELLGPRPRTLPPLAKPQHRTYRELQGSNLSDIDVFGNAWIALENIVPDIAGAPPKPLRCLPEMPSFAGLYFCIPQNDRLLKYWDTIEDRLFKIRHCQNIEGIERKLALFAPPIDPGLLVRAAAAGLSIGDIVAQGAGEAPNYRFQVLSQKANELVEMAKEFGTELLQVLEKRDAEALSQLRSTHEISLLRLVRDLRIQQVQEAQQMLEGLREARRLVDKRYVFYRDIKRVTDQENLAMISHGLGIASEIAATVLNAAGGTAELFPTFEFGGAGFGGSPVATWAYGGSNIGDSSMNWAQFFGGLGGTLHSAAHLIDTNAAYERRWDEWKLQERLAAQEQKQIDRQIAAAEIRVEISKAEVREHEKQMQQAEAMLEFVKDRKFTNQELYEWMIAQTSGLYFQAFNLAQRFALRTERAFHFELGPKSDGTFVSYIGSSGWDSLHKGLLAGQALLLDLKRMEVDYLERNRRELEITKHISLVRLNSDEFLKLKRGKKAKISIELPEWLFDMDFPGHFYRRIKSVSLSVPGVSGPFAGINCTLTLNSSEIRTGTNDESQIVRTYSRVESIATSSAHGDSGLFELNFQDGRFLPFEGAGAVSKWTLELPREDNRELDFTSITDVIIHLKYTARRGPGAFQEHAREQANARRNDEKTPFVVRLISLQDEFPSEWHRLTHMQEERGTRVLILDAVQQRMPYYWPGMTKAISLQLGAFDGRQIQGAELTVDEEVKYPEKPGIPIWKNVDWGKWKFVLPSSLFPNDEAQHPSLYLRIGVSILQNDS